jgi:nitrogen regulatory protein PII
LPTPSYRSGRPDEVLKQEISEKLKAREKGATGSTVISSARGEGIQVAKTFLGLSLETQRDVILLLVEEHMSRDILETIEQVGEFEAHPGNGIAFSIDVEDAVGVSHQVNQLAEIVEEEI